MKKLVANIFLLAIISSGYAQEHHSSFYLRKKNDHEKIIQDPKEVNADEVYTLGFGAHLNPNKVEGIDVFKIIVTRGENGEEGVFSFTGSAFESLKLMSDEYEGCKAVYPKMIDYKQDANNGEGKFYHQVMNLNFNGNYYLSRKGQDYSTHEEVDSYNLCAHAVGYKIVSYETKLVNGNYEQVPVYSDPIILVPVKKLKINTSKKIEPMPKSGKVGDVNDLKNLFGN